MKSLQERVVKLPRHARPLADSLIQARVVLARDLTEAQLIHRPEQREQSCHYRCAEQVGLIVRGSDREIERRAGLVPHAAVIARCDAESVSPRTQVGVKSLSAVADVLPLAIVALEFRPKPYLFGSNETERGIVNRQIANQRRKAHLRRWQVDPAVGTDLLDRYWWGGRVERQAMRIEGAKAFQGKKPQSSVPGLCDVRAEWSGVPTAAHSVCSAQNGDRDS